VGQRGLDTLQNDVDRSICAASDGWQGSHETTSALHRPKTCLPAGFAASILPSLCYGVDMETGGDFVRNALTRHLAVLALTLGLLFTVVPVCAEPVSTAVRPADSLVQVIQFYGRPGYYGRHRFYGRPHQYYGRGFYGRPRYDGRPQFHGPRYGYHRRSYIR